VDRSIFERLHLCCGDVTQMQAKISMTGKTKRSAEYAEDLLGTFPLAGGLISGQLKLLMVWSSVQPPYRMAAATHSPFPREFQSCDQVLIVPGTADNVINMPIDCLTP
jgi:hypothetical protein